MKKVKFKLELTFEGQEPFSLQDELALPNHADDETLGFSVRSFAEIVFNLLVLATCKGVGYKDSWKKRGELRGVAANIDRKYDRLSASFEDMEKHGRNDPEPRFDGSGDLAVYCILYLSSLLRQKYPTDFQKWWEREVEGFIKRFRKYDSETDDPKAARPAETPPGSGVSA